MCSITRDLGISVWLVKNRRVIAHGIHCNFVTIWPIGFKSTNLNAFCLPRINLPFNLPIAHGQSIVANSRCAWLMQLLSTVTRASLWTELYLTCISMFSLMVDYLYSCLIGVSLVCRRKLCRHQHSRVCLPAAQSFLAEQFMHANKQICTLMKNFNLPDLNNLTISITL